MLNVYRYKTIKKFPQKHLYQGEQPKTELKLIVNYFKDTFPWVLYYQDVLVIFIGFVAN